MTYSGNSLRGLDNSATNGGHGDDEFYVSADGRTLFIQGWTTTDVLDEVRVILSPSAVPDGGSTVALLGLSLGLIGVFEWRRKVS